MNQEAVLWILGIAIGMLSTAATAMIAFSFHLSSRLVAVETFIKAYIKGAADVLHNDDTPQLDALLEKLQKSYHDRGYDLTIEEWSLLKQLSEQVKNDLTREPGKRLSAVAIIALAGIAHDLANHRLMRNNTAI